MDVDGFCTGLRIGFCFMLAGRMFLLSLPFSPFHLMSFQIDIDIIKMIEDLEYKLIRV